LVTGEPQLDLFMMYQYESYPHNQGENYYNAKKQQRDQKMTDQEVNGRDGHTMSREAVKRGVSTALVHLIRSL